MGRSGSGERVRTCTMWLPLVQIFTTLPNMHDNPMQRHYRNDVRAYFLSFVSHAPTKDRTCRSCIRLGASLERLWRHQAAQFVLLRP